MDKQKNQIIKTNDVVVDTGVTVKRTDKRITSMTRRVFIQKVLLHTLAIVLLIAILVVLIVKLTK